MSFFLFHFVYTSIFYTFLILASVVQFRCVFSEKKGILFSGFLSATEKGLEPLLTESESAVLPITPFRIT